MAKGVLFIESLGFSTAVAAYFGSDEAYAELQSHLVERPESGSVIQGAAPLRKLRWKDPKRQKSKRGGLRLVYIHVPDMRVIFLLDVYGKDEAEDLSKAEKKTLVKLAKEFVDQLRDSARRGKL